MDPWEMVRDRPLVCAWRTAERQDEMEGRSYRISKDGVDEDEGRLNKKGCILETFDGQKSLSTARRFRMIKFRFRAIRCIWA